MLTFHPVPVMISKVERNSWPTFATTCSVWSINLLMDLVTAPFGRGKNILSMNMMFGWTWDGKRRNWTGGWKEFNVTRFAALNSKQEIKFDLLVGLSLAALWLLPVVFWLTAVLFSKARALSSLTAVLLLCWKLSKSMEFEDDQKEHC